MKVVFDTDVYVSAFLIPGSQGEEAFLLARRSEFTLYTSVAILTETAKVLRTKFYQEEDDIKAVLKMIARAAEVIHPSVKLTSLKDFPDNRILECAQKAEADVIVTGDKHILRLKRVKGTTVVRLADFLRIFSGSG